MAHKTSLRSSRNGTAAVDQALAPTLTPASGGGRPLRFSPSARRDQVSVAYEALRASIISGELAAGGRIVERSVADRLGLSRTPVRSALHRLQQEGFVEPSGRGADQRLTVAPLTRDDGHELFLLVGHLEGLAARQAAELAGRSRTVLVRRLRVLNRELAVESRKRTGVHRVYELDEQFHRAYVEDVAGPRVVALHRSVKSQIERYARFYASNLMAELPISIREHGDIIRAIGDGDARAAQRAVETNWHHAADRLAKTISQHGERGTWHLRQPRRDG